jgi:hypothetical protein
LLGAVCEVAVQSQKQRQSNIQIVTRDYSDIYQLLHVFGSAYSAFGAKKLLASLKLTANQAKRKV